MAECANCGDRVHPDPHMVWGEDIDHLCCSEACYTNVWTTQLGQGWSHWYATVRNHLKLSYIRYTKGQFQSATIGLWNAQPVDEDCEDWSPWVPGFCPWSRCEQCSQWTLNPVDVRKNGLVCSDQCYTRRESRLLLEGLAPGVEHRVKKFGGWVLKTAFHRDDTTDKDYAEIWRYQ